jgi:hypothetical protein
LFSCFLVFFFCVWASQKRPPRTVIWVCRWTSFGSTKNSERNQCLHFESGFAGMSVSTDWTEALQHCSTAALQRMDSTWNEVSNGPLGYSWQRSDLEMLIPSCDTLSLRFSVPNAMISIHEESRKH